MSLVPKLDFLFLNVMKMCLCVCMCVFACADDVPHMTDIVVDETFQEIDKDKSGTITLEEYISE